MVVVCLCCFVSTMNAAKDIYISATGDDSNDGLTEATPVKTLGRVHYLIGVGDVIHVSGIIDVSLETAGSVEGTNFQQTGTSGSVNGGFYFKAAAWHKSTMIGKDPEKDGFTSNGNGRLFRIDGGTHTFKNLLFTKGADMGNDGGCGLWLRGSVNTFINCHFVENKAHLDDVDPTKFAGTNGRGGAIHIMNDTTTFVNCYFGDNANTLGGAIFLHGGTVNISGCIFENHDLSAIANSKGGAIYSWAEQNQFPVITIDRCVFQNNSTSSDGGAITLNNLSDNRPNLSTVFTMTNSAFIKNESFNNGGAFHLNNTRAITTDSILIANTTFFGNIADKFGGAIYLGQAQPNSIFTMVNCSVIANYTRGNGGYGAGMTVYDNDTNMLKRIYNCIFDKNSSVSQNIYSDFQYRLPADVTMPGTNSNSEQEFVIKNTYISTTLSGNGVTASWFTNENYPGNNINYSGMTTVGTDLVSSYVNASGIDDDPEFYLQQSDFPVYAVPLKDNAPARTFGNAGYLTQFGIEATDQLGKERVISGTSCVAGATEATQDEIDNVVFSDYPTITIPDEPDAIKNVYYNENKNAFSVIDNVISLNNKEIQGATLVLYNLTGSIVKTGKNQLFISDLPKGAYIVNARVNGKNTVQKIIK